MVSGFLFFSLYKTHFRSGQAFFGFFSMVMGWFILTHFPTVRRCVSNQGSNLRNKFNKKNTCSAYESGTSVST